MVHLSSPTMIGTRFVFSIVTFFIMPTITTPYIKSYTNDPCIFGFLIGFIICALFWHYYAGNLVYNK